MDMYDIEDSVIQRIALDILKSKLEWNRAEDFRTFFSYDSKNVEVTFSLSATIDETSLEVWNDRNNYYPNCYSCNKVLLDSHDEIDCIDDEPFCKECYNKQEVKQELAIDN